MTIEMLPASWIPAAIAHKEAEKIAEAKAIEEMPRIMASISEASKKGCFRAMINFTYNFDVNTMIARLLEELDYKAEYFCPSIEGGATYIISW